MVTLVSNNGYLVWTITIILVASRIFVQKKNILKNDYGEIFIQKRY